MELQIFWFILLGVLLAGYAVLDGFDLGVGALHLYLARTDEERRVFMNAIGPVWDGNEVWLVTFGGALLAAFPQVYATAFSGLYLPLMLLLVGLIFRAVAIEFRSKRPERWWRLGWDIAFSLASIVSTVILGVAVANILRGVTLSRSGEIETGLVELLSPYALLVGGMTLTLFMLHGGAYLYMKTEGRLQARVRTWIWTGSGTLFVLYTLSTILTITQVPRATANFQRFPFAWLVVLANVLALASIPRNVFLQRPRRAFVSSGLTIVCLVALFGLAEFPNLLTAINDPSRSLTIYNASSSQKTLSIMRNIALLGFPFVLTYTVVIYWVFRGKTRIGHHGY
jgi:cytochrome d ubiquinol oxidase subunit II